MTKEIRPVRCFVCKKRMYYIGEKKYEPEYKLYDYSEQVGYVHQRCIKCHKDKQEVTR